MGVFVVDSNFFIQAHRASYPLDVAPSFWKKVKQLADLRKIISIDKVKNEIYTHKKELERDDLEIWCRKNLPKDFFKPTTAFVNEYSIVAKWVGSRNTHYKPAALNNFLQTNEADPWLIAFALNQKITIVTQEVSAPSSSSSIKIPDVCIALDVKFLNTIGLFRALGEKF